jgi:hypothetical protein
MIPPSSKEERQAMSLTSGRGMTSVPPEAAPSSAATSPAPSPTATQAPACPAPGSYLTAVRAGQYPGYDRVVFQFSGSLPAYSVTRVTSVVEDPKGTEVAMAGQSYLRVVFRGATAVCEQPVQATYTGPPVLTPFYPELLVVAKAGDFERVLSFGIGLAGQGGYHVWSLASPYRIVLDVDHVPLATFPGIWDITSWTQYWGSQYSVNNGHQPWLMNPAMVVEAWARGKWQTAPVIRQVTEPSGRIDTVTGTRPVTVPGPWVITGIDYGE